jgi:hypothetical protein
MIIKSIREHLVQMGHRAASHFRFFSRSFFASSESVDVNFSSGTPAAFQDAAP